MLSSQENPCISEREVNKESFLLKILQLAHFTLEISQHSHTRAGKEAQITFIVSFFSKKESEFKLLRKCHTEVTCAYYHNHTPAPKCSYQFVFVLPSSHLPSVHNNMQKTLQFFCGISVAVTLELLKQKKEKRKWKVGSGLHPKAHASASRTPLQLCALLLFGCTYARTAGGHAGRAVLRLTAEANILADNGQRSKATGRTA